MVKINNQNISVSSNDTEAIFLLNIASTLQTLPRFLKFDDKYNFNEIKTGKIKSYKVLNVLDLIKGTEDDIQYKDFYELVKKDFSNLEEITKLWIVKNNMIQTQNHFKLLVQTELDEIFDKKINVDQILKDRVSILTKLNSEIQQISRKIEAQNNFLKKINSHASKEYSDFETEKITLKLITDLKNYSLDAIFDLIKTNHFIPFVSFKDYYKIFEEFKPLDSFVNILPQIYLKILTTKTHSSKINLEKDYEDCLIYIENNNMIIEVRSNLKFIKQDELISRLKSIFVNLDFNIIDSIKTKFNGIYFISKTNINKFIFSDMVMNNKYFNNFLFIDESIKASKQKPGLYLHFIDPLKPELGEVKANIITKLVKPNDVEIRLKNRILFPFGSSMMRVKISSAKDMEAVNHFQNIFSKLLSMYEEEKNDVIKFYKKYIPDFKEEEVVEKLEEKKLDLKYLAPDLFLADYSRICQNKPSIIEDTEVKSYEKKGFQVLKYPKSEDEGNVYNYICDHPKKKFPGLILNTLPNRDVYPYIPCCFAKDQTTKDKSYYKVYYEGQELEEGEQQRIITTNKLVQKDKFALIPNNLKILFDTFDDSQDYLRKGVSRSKNSFIECILDVVKSNLPDNPEKRKKIVENERKSLRTMNLSLVKQECFDLSDEEILNYINKDNNYFDPKLFIRLLEEKYKLNIYLFTRNYGENEGYMLLPRHIQGHFYYPKNNKKNVLIYEHLGNESDRALYPQCELIVQWDMKSENFLKDFNNGSIFIEGVNNIYKILNGEYYVLDKINNAVSLKFPNVMVQSQYIDQYGKVRALKLKSGNKIINMFTSPLPPLNVIQQNLEEFLQLNNYNEIRDFLQENDINITKQNKNKTIIGGYSGNVFCSFLINKENNLNFEEYDFNLPTIKEKSKLQIFEDNRKLALIISSHFNYQYSTFVHSNDLQLNNNSILDFVKDKVLIDSNFKYKNILNNDFDNKSMYKGNKLVVNNEDTLKSLIYILRKDIKFRYEFIQNYHQLKFIPNYYNNISDFQSYPLQVLIQGENRIKEYINTPKFDNKIYEFVQVSKKIPYFIHIDNEIKLIVPCEDIQECLSTGIKLNNGNDIDEDIKYKVYAYNSKNDIKIFSKGTIKNEYDLKVLVYKHSDKIHYNLLYSFHK